MEHLNKHIKVHETAFMTSMLRAMNEPLSKDVYSKLWNNAKTKLWVDDYLAEVSSEDVHTHCIRNRFFLDKLTQLCKEEVDVVINFGAGFSMYPFLLNDTIEHIEIDKPEVIDFKKSQLTEWMNSGKLPKRNIHFIGVDFSTNYEDDLFTKLQAIKNNKKSFVLVEGVLFFLNIDETNKLFDFFEKLQSKGEYIGSVSYQHEIKESQVFSRLLNFFNTRISKTSKDDYLTIDDNYYKSKPKYEVLEHEDYFSYSKRIKNKVQLDVTDILNENFYVLQKTI